MKSRHVQSLLTHADTFQAQARYDVIEIEASTSLDDVRIKEASLGEHEVLGWAQTEPPLQNTNGESGIRLRLLISSPLAEHRGPADALQCSRDVFEAISAAWTWPPHVLPSLLPRTHDTAEILQFQDPCDAVIPARFGLAVTALAGRSLVTVLDSSENVSLTFLILRRIEDLSMVKAWIHDYGASMCIPSALILLLLDDGVNFGIRGRLKNVAHRLDAVRQSMGIPPWIVPWQSTSAASEPEPPPKKANSIDLPDCMTTLTGLNQAVAESHRSITRASLVLQHVRNMHECFRAASARPLHGPMNTAWTELRGSMDALEASIRYVQAIIEVRRSSTGGLIQTVFAMIAKKDNDVNNDIAQASLRMAAISTEAGKDSRKAAILTRQDSTDMRVMAGATLVFLPATFVATLFSSNFFNFQRSDHSVVSPWFWVYCVVTLALTAVVMIVWQLQARARDRKTAKLLHLKSAEIVQAILDEEQSADSMSVSVSPSIDPGFREPEATLKRRRG